jgi:N-acyl homoserine lactone hydrolase
MPQVLLLKPGSILRGLGGEILDARSSVALIRAGSKNIVVDSGAEDDGDQIIAALAKMGLSPEDIDILVNTHSHPDHCANNHLFSTARLLAPEDKQIIGPGVLTMNTPGHTLDSISVVVKSANTIVIAGDALPTFGNYAKDVPPALHVDQILAMSSMHRIIDIADIVIPGHDRPFSVTEKKYVDIC